MCVFYNVTPDWLLGIDEDMEQTKHIDSLMRYLLRFLGYGVNVSRLNGDVVFQEDGECGAFISLDEYKQFENTVFSYIKYQASALAKTARERQEDMIKGIEVINVGEEIGKQLRELLERKETE